MELHTNPLVLHSVPFKKVRKYEKQIRCQLQSVCVKHLDRFQFPEQFRCFVQLYNPHPLECGDTSLAERIVDDLEDDEGYSDGDPDESEVTITPLWVGLMGFHLSYQAYVICCDVASRHFGKILSLVYQDALFLEAYPIFANSLVEFLGKRM